MEFKVLTVPQPSEPIVVTLSLTRTEIRSLRRLLGEMASIHVQEILQHYSKSGRDEAWHVVQEILRQVPVAYKE